MVKVLPVNATLRFPTTSSAITSALRHLSLFSDSQSVCKDGRAMIPRLLLCGFSAEGLGELPE